MGQGPGPLVMGLALLQRSWMLGSSPSMTVVFPVLTGTPVGTQHRVRRHSSSIVTLGLDPRVHGWGRDRDRWSWARRLCAWHGPDLGGESSLRAVTTGIVSRRQLRRREAGWGGSPRRNPERTNRNRIGGRCDGVSQQWMARPDSRSDIAWVNPAAPGGKIRVLPREISRGLGTSPSRMVATPCDALGEVSRGHSSRPVRLSKGRIRKQGAV